MKIVIVGDGKVGYELTQQLSRENHDIVVIDSNKSVLEQSLDMLDVMVVHGNGASLQVQKEADTGASDLLIAATSGDEINLLCCIIARKLGCKHTIARIRNPEYADQSAFLKEDLGLSMTINPELSAASEIFRLLQYPSFIRRDSFAKGRVEIVELKVHENSVLNGCLLSELYQAIKVNVLVCAVDRGHEVYIPSGNFRLRAGDQIYVTAPAVDLMALVKALELSSVKIKEVLIIGGSRIAYYLATALIAADISVRIIDTKYERCQELAELLPRATIVHADGTNKQVLLSEGIERTDAVVTLTNLDEENVLVSMLANYLKVPKVVTKINRSEYNEVLRDKGIESVVSPKMLVAHQIVRYVRAMQNSTDSSAITLHRIVDDKVETLEFRVTEATQNVGKTLIEIELKENILIACINRNGRIILPKGSDTLEVGDTVIVVTRGSDHPLVDLNDIFAVEEETGGNESYTLGAF